jgi:hypothetical protein
VSCEARSFVIRYFLAFLSRRFWRRRSSTQSGSDDWRDLPCRIPERRCRAAMLKNPRRFRQDCPRVPEIAHGCEIGFCFYSRASIHGSLGHLNRLNLICCLSN